MCIEIEIWGGGKERTIRYFNVLFVLKKRIFNCVAHVYSLNRVCSGKTNVHNFSSILCVCVCVIIHFKERYGIYLANLCIQGA